MTPEGAVKKKVSILLKHYGCYSHAPVLNGMGKPSLDFICCYHGEFFAIETKAPGKSLTVRQEQTKKEMETAGGKVFKVSSKVEIEALIAWLDHVKWVKEAL